MFEFLNMLLHFEYSESTILLYYEKVLLFAFYVDLPPFLDLYSFFRD